MFVNDIRNQKALLMEPLKRMIVQRGKPDATRTPGRQWNQSRDDGLPDPNARWLIHVNLAIAFAQYRCISVPAVRDQPDHAMRTL